MSRARQERRDRAHAIPVEDLRQETPELSPKRDPQEHLLYPKKRGPKGTVIWENGRRPSQERSIAGGTAASHGQASSTRGATRREKMRSARYTSGTKFYLATGDMYATQQLLGHADVCTPRTSTSKARPPTSRTSSEGLGRMTCGKPFDRGGSAPTIPIGNSSYRKSGGREIEPRKIPFEAT